MNHYSKERKEAILKLLSPPHNLTVAEIAKQENISDKTLYNWRNNARKAGQVVPGKTKTAEDWSIETKLAVIVETATFSESELSRYCREKGLFVEQIANWKQDFILGYSGQKETQQQLRQQTKDDKKEINQLKKELRYKEKALAETAALLVLRKKLSAFWEEENEDK
jgi:transposase-like protein